MTTSTNAILFYGYCWNVPSSHPWEITSDDDSPDDEDVEADEGDENDKGWESRYARAKGCLPPSTPFPARKVTPTRENGWDPTPKDYSAAEQAIVDQHLAYWDAKETLVEAALCCIDTHCSGKHPMPYVAVKASRTISHRGEMHEITTLTIDPTWDETLAEFCSSMDIKTDGFKAAWWLVSNWD